jgi:hypothetical protein
MVLMYFINDFEMVWVTPVITGITLVFTFHIHCISIVRSLYFKISQLLFESHFCLLRLLHLSAYMFPFRYPGLQCRACYWGWSIQCVFVDSTVWLPYLLNLFLLILVHVHISVFCLITPLFPCICWSVAVHSLLSCRLYTVLLLVLGMLVWCGLFSHQIVGRVCICYLSLCSIFLLHSTLFVTLGFTLPLFHLLSSSWLSSLLLLLLLLFKCSI